MKLVFASPTIPYPAYRDGMSVVSYNVLLALARHHDVQLVAFDDGNAEGAVFFRNHGLTVTIAQTPRQHILRYYAWPLRQLPWAVFRWESAVMRETLRMFACGRTVDGIILHSPFLAGYVPACKGKPVILHAIDALSAWLTQFADEADRPQQRWHLRSEARKMEKVERHLFPLAKAVVVVADPDRRVLERRSLRTNVLVIPNGVDIEQFRPEPQESRLTREPAIIVFSGRMDFPQNTAAVQWFAKQVWPRICAQEPDAEWRIVGRNPAPSILQLADQDQRMTVVGAVPDMAEELRRATVYVAPLTFGMGMKNKVLEAMACGCAVVALPNGVSGLGVEDNRHVLVASGATEMAEHVLFLLRRADERDRLGRAAREWSVHHPWRKATQAYLQLYERTFRR